MLNLVPVKLIAFAVTGGTAGSGLIADFNPVIAALIASLLVVVPLVGKWIEMELKVRNLMLEQRLQALEGPKAAAPADPTPEPSSIGNLGPVTGPSYPQS